jgi:ATP/maltotriose-dependent transcriptional regulator MalT
VQWRLLERDAELGVLLSAADELTAGRGSVALVLGEAGIGKTSLLRAFQEQVSDRVRLLIGACDDLLTPRTFGPLRDIAADTGGPLAAALTGEPERERVYDALVGELSGPGPPTVLVIEDVHWADDATLDALRFVVRRIERLPALLLLTYRDDDLQADGLRQLLGALSGPTVRRLRLAPLTARAVDQLSDAVGAVGAEIYAVTAGNPFFVTEVLACPIDDVPHSVLDAVMARTHQLPTETQEALDLLAVVPSHVEYWLALALIGSLAPLEPAEQSGILLLQPHGLAFRHELARRALELSITETRRREINKAVVEALIAHGDPELGRVVHHAVAAADVVTVLEWAPLAAREAAGMGSHRQALAHYETVVAHLDRLTEADQARILVEYCWQLYAAQRFVDAVDRAEQAVRLHEQLGDPVALGETLVALSRSAFMADRPTVATETIERAVGVLAGTDDVSARAYATTYQGAVLALTDQQEAALPLLAQARELAEPADRKDLEALCLNYVGCALVDLGDAQGVDMLRASLTLAQALSHYEYVARAYTNLGEALYQLNDFPALESCIAEGVPYCVEHELPAHAFNLEAHRAMLLVTRGDWDAAEALLRSLVSAVPDAGQLARLTLPTLGRLAARRGYPEAETLLDQAWATAMRSQTLQALAPAGLARLEWAWLNGDLSRADTAIDVLLERTDNQAGAWHRGRLMRYLRRAGRPAEIFAGCPAEWAAGLRGDWSAAAAAWDRLGDSYERALELGGSGDMEATIEALDVLDRLGATPAARWVRRQLRGLGASRIPRPRRPATLANPVGLTGRQREVLTLLADGLTNAEIAERLVLSTRTVDHHVSAILVKLEVPTRRRAVARAGELKLVD